MSVTATSSASPGRLRSFAKGWRRRRWLRALLVWLGVALLAASWLPGWGYYQPADLQAWSLYTAFGFLCLLAVGKTPVLTGKPALIAGLLALPAVLVCPWPGVAGVAAFSLGNLLAAGGQKTMRWGGGLLGCLSNAAILGGTVLVVQAIVLQAYSVGTSRNHDLPGPLTALLGAVLRLLGVESSVAGDTIALHSMRELHRLAATWELLLDPVTVCFLAGAGLLLLLFLPTGNARRRNVGMLNTAWSFGAILLLWLPLRAGLLVALYLHELLVTPYEANVQAMRLFWSTPIHLLLLAGPVVILAKFFPRLPRIMPRGQPAEQPAPSGRQSRWPALPIAILACAGGVLSMTFGLFWEPLGTRQAGRVVVEEYHPDPSRIWEPTGRPYDETWYGQPAGYNYACIYDYCSKFYEMSRWTSPLTRQALADADVLVLKVPTRPYSDREIELVVDFVERGGGLLLIGEHTNVYRTSDHLNPVAERFGFAFRPDCLFGVNSVFEQHYEPPLLPHPIVQNLPALDFATSCSIAPRGAGRAAIRGLGLKNALADYHADNYYPQPRDQAAMRYGAFVQLWTTRYGRGRVAAFTDSTIFSNFCVADPGKSELMLGMLEWLNHRGRWSSSRPVLLGLGILLLSLAGLFSTRLPAGNWPLLLAAGLLGFSFAVPAIRHLSQQAMPPPPPRGPFVRVILDRTLCTSDLSKNGFVEPDGQGFGVFAQWILRLGYFPARRSGDRVFDGDLLVLIGPTHAPSDAYLRQLDSYLRSGGKVLIVEYPRDASSVNQLLAPYSMAVKEPSRVSGSLQTAFGGPSVPVEQALVIHGGEPFAWIDGQPVAARIRHGKGTVAVIGFGTRFRDENMGRAMEVVPDRSLRQVFELEYQLLRWMVDSGQG